MPSEPGPSNAPRTSTGRLRGVALGAGYFAPYQYEAWNRIPEVDIVAMYNRSEAKAAPILASTGCLATTRTGRR